MILQCAVRLVARWRCIFTANYLTGEHAVINFIYNHKFVNIAIRHFVKNNDFMMNHAPKVGIE